jgi:hypothetical protein
MRSLNGIHAWNPGCEDGWPEALKICSPTSGITILDALLEHWYPELRSRMGPEFLIHVRFMSEGWWATPNYGRHWNELEPEAWADECYRRIVAAGPAILADPFVVVTGANEQDLAVEGHPEAATDAKPTVAYGVYNLIWLWQWRWVRRLRQRLGKAEVKIATAPLAGGHDIPVRPPDYEYQLDGFRALVDEVDALCAHAYIPRSGIGRHEVNDGYWHALRPLRPKGYRERVQGLPPIGGIPDPGGLMVQYPDKVLILSEFGNWRHWEPSENETTLTEFGAVYRAYSQSGRCALITPFIFNSGPEHRDNRIWGNAGLVRGLQDMERFGAASWPPGEDNVAWDRHQVFDDWQKALGGQGFNPHDAFGQFREQHQEIDCGVFVSPYLGYNDPTCPYIYAYTTTGIFVVPKGGGQVIFADRESELPFR